MAKLEAELFLSGNWKNYQDLEDSLSMPELVITLEAQREAIYEQRKFAAALKGVNIDEGGEDPLAEARKANSSKLASDEDNLNMKLSPDDILSDKKFGLIRHEVI